MPAVMRVLWDVYWTAMDMENSIQARRATAATREKLQYSHKMMTKEQLGDLFGLFRSLKTLKPKADIGLRLLPMKNAFKPMNKKEVMSLYDGSWFQD